MSDVCDSLYVLTLKRPKTGNSSFLRGWFVVETYVWYRRSHSESLCSEFASVICEQQARITSACMKDCPDGDWLMPATPANSLSSFWLDTSSDLSIDDTKERSPPVIKAGHLVCLEACSIRFCNGFRTPGASRASCSLNKNASRTNTRP